MLPATPPLRPLTMSQLLDRSVSVFRDHFWVFLGIVAILQIPVVIINTFFTGSSLLDMVGMLAFDPFQPAPVSNSGIGSLGTLASLVTTLLAQLGNAALCWAVAAALLGDQVSIGSAYRQLRARWQSVVGLWFLSMIITIALVLWWIIACVIGWFTGLGMLMFFTYVITPLAMVVVMVEGRTAWEALPRAWNLARQRFWWVLFLVMLLTVLGQALIAGPQTVLVSGLGIFLVDQGIGGDFSNFVPSAIMINVVSLLLGLLILPVYWTGISALYLDLRVRFEGTDLALQLAQFDVEMDAVVPAVEQVAAAPRAAPRRVTPEGREWASFLALTVGPFVLLLLLYGVLLALAFFMFSVTGF